MGGDPLADWSNFFVAEAGAAAALAGLLFVAVSINLTRILEFAGLPVRAVEVLLALGGVLAISSLGLIPHQGSFAFGIELATLGTLEWALLSVCWWRTRAWSKLYNPTSRLLANQLPPLPFIGGGIALALGHPAGLYGMVAATLLSFLVALFGAWILLIEIQR